MLHFASLVQLWKGATLCEGHYVGGWEEPLYKCWGLDQVLLESGLSPSFNFTASIWQVADSRQHIVGLSFKIVISSLSCSVLRPNKLFKLTVKNSENIKLWKCVTMLVVCLRVGGLSTKRQDSRSSGRLVQNQFYFSFDSSQPFQNFNFSESFSSFCSWVICKYHY